MISVAYQRKRKCLEILASQVKIFESGGGTNFHFQKDNNLISSVPRVSHWFYFYKHGKLLGIAKSVPMCYQNIFEAIHVMERPLTTTNKLKLSTHLVRKFLTINYSQLSFHIQGVFICSSSSSTCSSTKTGSLCCAV